MSWFLLAILSVLFYSLATVVQRGLMKDEDNDPVVFMVLFQFLVTAVIAIYFIASRTPFPNISQVWPNLLLNGFLISIASLCMFKSLKLIDVADFTIIGASSTFWGLLTASVFLKESVTIEKIIGTILVTIGIITLVIKKKGFGFNFNLGHLYSLISASAFGIAFTNEVFLVGKIGVMQNLLIGFFLPGLIVLVLFPKSIVKMRSILVPLKLGRILLFSLLYLSGAIAIFAAYSYGGEASKIYPIGKAEVIITTILGVIFLKEYDHPIRKILAVLTTFAGVLLLR